MRAIRTMGKIALILFFLTPLSSVAQSIEGKILSTYEEPVFGATIHWLGTGIGCTSQEDGSFTLSKEGINDFRLIIRYVGYETDTLNIGAQQSLIQLITQMPSRRHRCPVPTSCHLHGSRPSQIQ